MGLINRVIHHLNKEHLHVPYFPNLTTEIKQNIKSLLNTNPNDCASIPNTGLLQISQSSIEKSELINQIGQEIASIIRRYEKRIQITSFSYDDIDMPWKLSFTLSCHLRNDRFEEFNLIINFYNNRYYEVV